jgi:uncharacterized protein (DUF1778 family)
MPRPPKKPEERKSHHLRVPVTAEQRALVEEACRLEGRDFAAWAREVLLAAARRAVERARKAGGNPA